MNQYCFLELTHTPSLALPAWQNTLRRKGKLGKPLLAQLITADEAHNPYLTVKDIRVWPDVWVVEHLERHGFCWDGQQWTRSTINRALSWRYRYRPGESTTEHQEHIHNPLLLSHAHQGKTL
jgi:hypothetical protein